MEQGGTIVWVLDADSSKFTAALKQAQTSAQSTASKIDTELNKSLSSLGNTARSVGGIFDGVASSIAGFAVKSAAFIAAGSFGMATFVKSAAELQTASQAMKVLTGQTETANMLMSQFATYANNTPFQFAEVAKAGRTLLGFGIQANDVFDRVKVLGDIAAATGADFTHLALVYGQVNAAGRLMGQDSLQLINNNIPITNILTKKLGISAGELRDRIEEGAISADMFNQALLETTQKGGFAFQGVDVMAKTVNGRMSTLNDTILETGRNILGVKVDPNNGGLIIEQGGAFDLMSKKVIEATKWLNDNKQQIVEIGGFIINNLVPAIKLLAITYGIAKGAAIAFKTVAAVSELITGYKSLTIAVAASRGGWATLGATIGTFANGAKLAFTGLTMGLQGIMVSGGIAGFFSSIGTAIAGIPALIGGALSAIPGIIAGAGSAIMGALAAIPVVGWIILIVAAIVGLFTYFYNTSEGFRNFVNGILGAVGKAISDFAGGVVKFFKPIGEAIMGAFNGAADFIGGVFKTIGDIVSTAFGVISAGVGVVMNVLKPLFQIIGFIGYAIYGFGQIVFTVFSTIFQVIYTIVSTIVQIIGVILYGTLLKIGQFFTWIFTNIGAVVTTVFTAVSGFIMTIWNGIVAFLTPILTAIGNFFTTIFNAIYSTITTVMGAIWAFIEPAINAISAVFTTVFNAVAGVVSAVFEKIKTYIINPIATVVKYVGDTIGKIATFIGDAVKKAYDTVAGWINSFTSAGKNIIDGIVQGMKNAGDAVVNFIKNVCSNALNAVKNFFGIKSPSKVMAKMGEYLMQGFGNGIDREGSVAVKAATNAAEGVLGAFDGMQASVGNMQTQFGVTNTMAAGNIAPVTVDTANATSANGVTINQTNQVYSDVDMEQVNRNLTWELGKL